MEAERGVVVRMPNHVGDAVMALPALEAAAPDLVIVAHPLSSLVALATKADIIPLGEGAAGFVRVVRRLRAERPHRGLLFPASFSSALVFAAGKVPERRGTATDGRGRLLTDPIAPEALRRLHRSSGFWYVATGEEPAEPPVPRLELPTDLAAQGRELIGEARPSIGMVPGGAASSRRWDR